MTRVLFVQPSGPADKGKPEQYLCYMLDKIGLIRKDAAVVSLDSWEYIEAEVVVPMGSEATAILVAGSNIDFDMLHGIPVYQNGKVFLPMYHYSGGVNNSRIMHKIQEDFQVLKQLLDGSYEPVLDEYPTPNYYEVANVREAKELLSQKTFSLDTETVDGQLWSIQVSSKPGTGTFIPVALFGHGDSVLSLDWIFQIPESSKVIVHNYLYDARFLSIPTPLDTMIMAYLLQMPMGLKELAKRLCGMEMHSYEDYTLSYRSKKAISYLDDALCMCQEITTKGKAKTTLVGYPDVAISEWVWDNKLGMLLQKSQHPRNIAVKMQALREHEDPYADWYKLHASERAPVEEAFGLMPDADLRDAPRDKAVYYSTRDADATLRVALKLWPLLEEAGLMDVLKMEMGAC